MVYDRLPDHPRSRGVYENLTLEGVLDAGSSPLARGLRLGGLFLPALWRIIPARAGFTLTPTMKLIQRVVLNT